MSEPSYHPSSQGPMPTYTIAVHDVRTGPPHEGQLGEGVWLQTDRGTIHAILHPSPEARYGVIWVCGARGGFGGPGQGAYVRLAEALRQEGIVSLRSGASPDETNLIGPAGAFEQKYTVSI
jgi:hypothetical protein